MLYASSQLTQKTFKRTTPSYGCNGVVPVSCNHESLCTTVSSLCMTRGQIVQIGHWSSCAAVYADALSIGNPWRPSFLDEAQLVCTLLTPGSERLFVLSPKPHASLLTCSSERHRQREDLVWFQVKCPDTWTCLQVSGVTRHSETVYSWPASMFLVKQLVSTAPCAVAWHLVFNSVVYKSSPMPSEFFSWHDRDYWAKSVDDIHSPANRLELKSGRQEICQQCKNALDGTICESKVIYKPIFQTSGETQCSPVQTKRLKLTFKVNPVHKFLSLDEFFN